ncbi:DNA-binding transcriptional regulator ume6 [Taxawa tesnikishii (nom. ined.)]|nr:DNA-binding transcriptional regulator ume6 [Dothideales sp. JES 119]
MSTSAPATSSKPNTKMAAPTITPANANAKSTANKMHKRSRTGCFTCRLRRKKCDEGKPGCRACRHLGLKCDYKRPMWWSNSEQRREHKETIKEIIKRTQLSKKSAPVQPPAQTPRQSRAPSVDSPPFTDCGFTHVPNGYFDMPPPPHVPLHPQYPMFSPFEVDIKTERQIFVNDVPTRRDSTISTFSTFQPPPMANGLPAFPADSWVQQDYFESRHESFTEEPIDFEFFEFPHGQMTPTHEAVIEVEESDKPLLNHFLDKVAKLIFPILDANQHGSARSDIILPALETNRCFLHCCLSVAGIHLKATERVPAEQIDNDIMRHRYATISELCEALNQDTDHSQILEATLATNLVNKLELPQSLVLMHNSSSPSHPPFNMTLTSWIDILGSTMLGRSPVFADTYRELNIAGASAGLAELMGCEDKIMFLISEIACLEARKLEGMDEVMLCKYIEILGTEIGMSEPAPGAVAPAFSGTGAIRPKQLNVNMTAVFRLAARIYLCAMVPGFAVTSPSITNLVSAFADAMEFIPAGPEGMDRSLIWPLLVAGSAADFGSFGKVREILKDVWQMNETAFANGDYQGVHWRDVMQQKGWDFLLI